MKKTVICLCVFSLLAVSCRNRGVRPPEQKEPHIVTAKEEMISKDMQVNLQNMIESAKGMKPLSFVSKDGDGSITLSDKEKMVKPDYLLPPSVASAAVTLAQKYSILEMLCVDRTVMELYDMPTDELDAQLARLLADINDPAMQRFISSERDSGCAFPAEAHAKLVEEEYNSNRANFFWQGESSALVEAMYILTRDVDRFLPAFDDNIVADITFDFICLHDNLLSLMEFYPDMRSLNDVLSPLYVINAISVPQLRGQLLSVKADVEKIREYLIK